MTESAAITPLNDVVREVPQSSRTHGLDGFLRSRLLGVGTQPFISFSTASSTESSWVAVASRNTSSESERGPAPTNSGSADSPAIREGVRRHSVDLLRLRVAGLNWSCSVANAPPGWPPTVDGGSMMVSWARVTLAGTAEDILSLLRSGCGGRGWGPSGRGSGQDGRRPTWAISKVSRPGWELFGSNVGPSQRTGTMPSTCQLTMGVPSGCSATISPSLGCTRRMISSNQRAILVVSLVTARVRVMFDQVMRPGSW